MFENNKTWPFEEARRIYEKIGGKVPEKGYVLFETGYGPSGLPHIGTFGEVVRTSFVKLAFEKLYPEIPTKLISMSDDLDALRKVPENVPNQEMLKENLGKPLTSIPDPFGTDESFGWHNNNKLLSFLEGFGFVEGKDYNFVSATDCYKSGKHNEMLHNCAVHYKDLMDIMLPTLGEERASSYSPFMPIEPETGKVIASGVISVNPENDTIKYIGTDGKEKESSYLNGGCKLQWKCDFGGRWASLGVDYEIYGKDHYPNEPVYRGICKALGKEPPVNFFYELFLDDKGQKISKSKGNGLSVDEWLRYGGKESLALFMYQKPKTAKRLYFDVIPKAVDEYMTYLSKYQTQNDEEKSENPIYFIHYAKTADELKQEGFVPCKLSFSMILNLASVCNPENEDILFDYLEKYDANIDRKNNYLRQLVGGAINYYNDFVKPNKKYVKPEGEFLAQVQKLKAELESGKYKTEEELQTLIYDLGNELHAKDEKIALKDWFKCLYQALLGTETGPRMGSFIAIYGVENTLSIMQACINNNCLNQ